MGHQHTQLRQSRAQGVRGHWRAVIRMQHRRRVPATFTQQGALHQPFRQVAGLTVIHFPGNNLAAINVQYQVQVPVLATDRRGTVANVPTPDLVRPRRGKAGRLGHFASRCHAATMIQLLMLF